MPQLTGRKEVQRAKQTIDATFKRVAQLDLDIELRADFARYLCVLVSGWVETAMAELLSHYARRTSSPSVTRYVTAELEWFNSPKCEKLLQLVGAFDPRWRVQIESALSDDEEAALNSVVALRNKIAHGESVALSFAQMASYYDRVGRVISHVANVVEPAS